MMEPTLATHLQRLLAEKEMSSADLSRASGVSVASLSRILKGHVNPSFANMQKIAEALGVSLDRLAGASPHAAAGAQVAVAPTIRATFGLDHTDKTAKESAQLLQNAARGTWVSCWTEDLVDPEIPLPACTRAEQVGTRKLEVELAFPHEMIEAASITGLLSVLSAAVTSTGARLLDVHIPDVLLRTYRGPTYGIQEVRDLSNKYGRPLLSCTLRPMLGLSPKMYGRAAYEALRGGVDLTCDPTLMHDIPGNHWRDRYRYCAEAVHTASAETNEHKVHAANVTAGTLEHMLQRAEFAKELELGMIMVDSAAIGWAALQSLTDWCHGNDLIICAMGGRALAGNMLAEQLEAKLLRLTGCDVASIGSPLKGSVVQRRMSAGTITALREAHYPAMPEGGLFYAQNFAGHAGTMPAVGGGHNPWHFPRLLDALGDDTIFQCGGSVMGHPWGSAAGATANRVAIESLVQARGEGMSLSVDGRAILQRALKYSPELKTALEFWQEGAFLFGVISGTAKHTDRNPTVDDAPPAELSGVVQVKNTPKITTLRRVDTEEEITDE